MLKFTVSAEARPYVNALKALTQRGAASSDLTDSILLRLPCVAAEAKTGDAGAQSAALLGLLDRYTAPEPLPTDRGYALLGSMARELRLLLGIDGGSAKDRRAKATGMYYTEVRGEKPPDIADDRRRRWDSYRQKNGRLEHLFNALYLALWRTGEATRISASSDASVLIAPNGYYLEKLSTYYNFPEDHAPAGDQHRDLLQVRELRAARTLGEWSQSRQTWGFGSDMPEVALYGPGTLEIVDQGQFEKDGEAARGYTTSVHFDRELEAKDEITFILHHRFKATRDSLIRLGERDKINMVPNLTIMHLHMTVHFPPNRLPRTVWRFENMLNWQSPGDPTADNLVSVPLSGVCEVVYLQPTIGRHSGIAWEW